MIAFLVLLMGTVLLFLSLVETAFSVLMRLPERLDAEREHEGSVLVAYLDDPLKFFVPVRVLRGTALVAAVVLLSESTGDGLGGGLMLFGIGLALLVGVGQVLPALLVRRRPERFLDLLLPPFTVVANLLAPFTALIITWLGSENRGSGEEGEPGTPDAGPGAEAEAEQRAEENRLLRSVVDFGDTLVREVMTPRPDLVAVRSTDTVQDLLKLVGEQEYSRLPVFTDNLDNIVGLVVVKDLMQLPETFDRSQPVAGIMRPAAFAPETKRVADLLREFQQGRFQLAIVVDEYGGTAGLVTIEDVVEELVGEIRDEYDSEAEPIVDEGDGVYVFSAKVSSDDMVDLLGIQVDDGGFETVGGYVLARVGRVPLAGERFDFDGLAVEVLEAERRRIHKVRIKKAPAGAAGSGG
jgi:CBS domain containing-hemolysin-like protein